MNKRLVLLLMALGCSIVSANRLYSQTCVGAPRHEFDFDPVPLNAKTLDYYVDGESVINVTEYDISISHVPNRFINPYAHNGTVSKMEISYYRETVYFGEEELELDWVESVNFMPYLSSNAPFSDNDGLYAFNFQGKNKKVFDVIDYPSHVSTYFTITRDQKNRINSVSWGDNDWSIIGVLKYEYDAKDNIVSIKKYNADGWYEEGCHMTYNALSKLTHSRYERIARGRNNEQSIGKQVDRYYSYDNKGNLTEKYHVVSQYGRKVAEYSRERYTNTYSKAGDLIKIVRYSVKVLGNGQEERKLLGVWHAEYDVNHNWISIYSEDDTTIYVPREGDRRNCKKITRNIIY